MIHHIKALHNGGEGSSIRTIAESLNISRNTVRKYLRMGEEEISKHLNRPERSKLLDPHREYMSHLLQSYPKISSGKILRKLKSHGLETEISSRSVRRYLQQLKKEVPTAQRRYYEPIIDHTPGIQCQVDGGELRAVWIAGHQVNVYFVVFVLSYSRMMWVSVSLDPINTESFIRMHDDAFCFFEGVVEECVYDQTKLVVIKEEFREVWLNQRFHHYANHVGFRVRVCEGYDPESKGKVEAGVKYVQNDFFYGEQFSSADDLKKNLYDWVKNVANLRVHGTTREVPWDRYDQFELPTLRPYLRPKAMMQARVGETRQVDKTSLISYQSNKYSVPSKYQSSQVWIKREDGELWIYAMNLNDPIAKHRVSLKKGEIIKNRSHYRSREDQITRYEKHLDALLGNALASLVCQKIKQADPSIYKDQLYALTHLINQYPSIQWLRPYFNDLVTRESLKVSFIRDYLEAALHNPLGISETTQETLMNGTLECYSPLVNSRGEGRFS